MVGFITSIAVLATLAASTVSGAVVKRAGAPQGSYFNLKTSNGLYLQAFHTEAGGNALVGLKNPNKADLPKFFINGDDNAVKWNDQGTVYEIYLAPGLYGGDTAPREFHAVELNDFKPSTSGFSINQKTNELIVAGNGNDFSAFEICKVKTVSSEDAEGPDFQLLWASNDTKEKNHPACHQVELTAEYVAA